MAEETDNVERINASTPASRLMGSLFNGELKGLDKYRIHATKDGVESVIVLVGDLNGDTWEVTVRKSIELKPVSSLEHG